MAARALRTRELSGQRLAQRLAAAAVAPATAAESLDLLSGAGLVDDRRFARVRAEALAERSWGDAAIEHDLERQGIDPELVRAALEGLAGELERARKVVERRGRGPRTARYLASKGFGEEAVGVAVGNEP